MADQWTLYYHAGFAGRGEFVRLMFEEAGVPYAQPTGNMKEMISKGEIGGDGFPNFAVPIIKKGDFTLSQTPVICKYLGKKFGLWPETEADMWHADAINTTIHDFIGEACYAYHGKNFMGSYESQKAETQPYIEWFRKERLAKWLTYLEKCLAFNKGGHGFVVGTKCTYVDVALMHVLRAACSQFPEDWAKLDAIPLLKAFKDRMSARPKLAAYYKSDRYIPFVGDSMM